MNCTDKFLKHSERVGARFAEQNAGASTLPVGIGYFRLTTLCLSRHDERRRKIDLHSHLYMLSL